MGGIGLVNPWALWLAAGAAAPVIIHLLLRQKPRQVKFPLVRLIQKSQSQVNRRNRLRHLLLLALRVLAILLLALLIARPAPADNIESLRAKTVAVEETAAAVIVLDDSLSMRYLQGDTSWFERARERAHRIIDGIPTGAVTAVVTTSPMSGRLVADAGSARAQLESLEASAGTSSCWGALSSSAELLSQEFASRKIFLLTDMTSAAWQGYETRDVLDLGPGVDLYVVPVGTGNIVNGGIVEVYHEGQPAMTGTRFDVSARALAGGAAMDRTVQFEFDGQPIGRRRISPRAGQQEEMEFVVELQREGFHRGRVSFLNPDGLVHDDVRHFTLNVTRQIKVLILEDDPVSQGGESESFFLRRALVPPGGAGADAPFRIERAAPVGITELTPERADVVILASPERINDPAWAVLERYVAQGGGVLVFAGPEALAEPWSTAAARSLLGVEVVEAVDAPEQYAFRMSPVDENHPLVQGLEAANADVGEMRLRKILQVRPLQGAQEVFSFGRERPAVVVSQAGGRIAVITSPPDNRWGEFATTANPRRDPFLPLLHESMFYLAGRVATGLSFYTVGEPVPLRYPESQWPTIVKVTPPGGEPQTLSTEAGDGLVTWRDTGRPGYYGVQFERRDRTWDAGFAVNTPPQESDLRRVSLEDIRRREVISARTVALLEESEPLDWNVGDRDGKMPEYTPLLALAVLLVFTAEGFLSNRFYKGRPTNEQATRDGG